MQITITGPRGGGSTSVAVEIAQLMRSKGHAVEFVSTSRDAPSEVQVNPTAWRQMRIVIVDGVEPEDELAVRESLI